ncbi:MAG: DapH/DapD/GlmU-related protein [Candidatus Bathyarchaeota archaeon]
MIRKKIVNKTAVIDAQTELPSRIFISANVHIFGKVTLNEDIYIEPNVILYGPVEIGTRSYIGPNSIIGFHSRDELQEILSQQNNLKLSNKKITRIGKNSILRSNCVIYSDVEIGDNARLGHNVMVREDVTIGRSSLIGTDTVIDGSCKVGHNVSIQTGVYLSTHSTVEDLVFLDPRCVLINDRYLTQKKFKLIGPTICRGTSIGANATIFPGVTIGAGAIVGAGAVVIGDVPPRTIVVGIPAKRLKDVPSDWRIHL